MPFDPNTINLVKPTDKALTGTLIDDDAFLIFRGNSENFVTYRFNYQSLVALIQTFIPDITVIDSLSSTSITNALSAAQGTALKGILDDLITTVSNKLDTSAYNNYYKGTFISLVALQNAFPSAGSGDYAMVDTNGNNSVLYIWDATDSQWVLSLSISSYNTDTIVEGTTNLYFTSQRVQTIITGLLTDSLTSTSNTTMLTANNGKILKDALDLLTTDVGNKLDTSAYNEHYRGTYTTLGNLQTSVPTGNAGNYALVDSGIGSDALIYIWDLDDGWVISGSVANLTSTDSLAEGSTNLYFTNNRAIGAFTRQNITVSEATFLNQNESFSGTVVMAPQYKVLQIVTTAPMRVRLYTTLSKRDDDLSRTIGTPIPEGSGLMMEFVSSAGLLSADLTPIVDGFSSTENIPYSVVSTDAGGCNVDFTLNFVKTGV